MTESPIAPTRPAGTNGAPAAAGRRRDDQRRPRRPGVRLPDEALRVLSRLQPVRAVDPGAVAVGEGQPVVRRAPDQHPAGGALGGVARLGVDLLVLEAVPDDVRQALVQAGEAEHEGARPRLLRRPLRRCRPRRRRSGPAGPAAGGSLRRGRRREGRRPGVDRVDGQVRRRAAGVAVATDAPTRTAPVGQHRHGRRPARSERPAPGAPGRRPAPPGAVEGPPPDGRLHQTVGQLGQRHGQRQPSRQQGPAIQGDVQLRPGDDEDRPVPEVDAVGALPDPAQRRRAQSSAAEPRRRGAPPRPAAPPSPRATRAKPPRYSAGSNSFRRRAHAAQEGQRRQAGGVEQPGRERAPAAGRRRCPARAEPAPRRAAARSARVSVPKYTRGGIDLGPVQQRHPARPRRRAAGDHAEQQPGGAAGAGPPPAAAATAGRTAPRPPATRGAAAAAGARRSRSTTAARRRSASWRRRPAPPARRRAARRPRPGSSEHGEGQHREEQHVQRRQQAPGPAQPEGAQVDAARAGATPSSSRRGDQEAADDEEDVDAEEAARQQPRIGVVEQHGADGDGAQSVDAGQVRQPPRLHDLAVSPRDRGGRAGRAPRGSPRAGARPSVPEYAAAAPATAAAGRSPIRTQSGAASGPPAPAPASRPPRAPGSGRGPPESSAGGAAPLRE